MNVLELSQRKQNGDPLVVTTCYDYWSARILNESPVDMILVGDSAAMVMHGFRDTIPATVDMMSAHVAAVKRGAPDKFIVADMPFLSYRKELDSSMEAVASVMRAGAQAVKFEGVRGHEDLIHHVVDSGIPVMGHIGLIPQSVNRLGGYRVQGRDGLQAEALMSDAMRLEECGCFSVVLECVVASVAERITSRISIPTIGIGSGAAVDGQVLVLHDLCGFNTDFSPRFVRRFAEGDRLVRDAVAAFAEQVKGGKFPSEDESFS